MAKKTDARKVAAQAGATKKVSALSVDAGYQRVWDDFLKNSSNLPARRKSLQSKIGHLIGADADGKEVAEVTDGDGALCAEGFYRLYERRLLPVFRHVNDCAAAVGKPALLTIPGLGCGQFAGPFKGQLGTALLIVLERFLSTHGASLPNLKAVYYAPINECSNLRQEIHGIACWSDPCSKGMPGDPNSANLPPMPRKSMISPIANSSASSAGTMCPGRATTSSVAVAARTMASKPPPPIQWQC